MLGRFIAPQVVYFRVETRDRSNNNALANPTNVKLTLIRPDGTLALNAQTMANPSTGVFTYSYPVASGDQVGTWVQLLKITDNVGESDTRSVAFELVA